MGALIKDVANYTMIMQKYGYDKINHNYGMGVVIDKDVRETENVDKKFIDETIEGKPLNLENLYKFYLKSLKHKELGEMRGEDGVIFDIINQKHVDYSKRLPYQSKMIEIGTYDHKNIKYSIDMDYLDFIKKDKEKAENYIKQSFLNHYLFLGTSSDDNIYSKEIEDFLKIKPFFNFKVPEVEEMGLSWPILDNYDEKGVMDDNDYLDIKKFLELDDDTILLCMVGDPNPDYPEYYEPEPTFIFPISRSYLKNLYNPLNSDGTYKNHFASFAYQCSKQLSEIDPRDEQGRTYGDTNFNVTTNQLHILSPYFVITGSKQELLINTRDAMMLMYSTHKVFALRKEKEIPINANVDLISHKGKNSFGNPIDVESAHHCQQGSEKPIYRVFMADIDEYEKVERAAEAKIEAITKEELYKQYPKIKKILETSQRCKDPLLLSERDLELEFYEQNLLDTRETILYMSAERRTKAIEKLKTIYEKTLKIKKIMKLDIPFSVKTRAQQEVQNSSVDDLTDKDISDCVYDEMYEIIEIYIGSGGYGDNAFEFGEKDKLIELATGPYIPLEEYESRLIKFVKENDDKLDNVDIDSMVDDIQMLLSRFNLYKIPSYNFPSYIIDLYENLLNDSDVPVYLRKLEYIIENSENLSDLVEVMKTLVNKEYINILDSTEIIYKVQNLINENYQIKADNSIDEVYYELILKAGEVDWSTVTTEEIENIRDIIEVLIFEKYEELDGSEIQEVHTYLLSEIKDILGSKIYSGEFVTRYASVIQIIETHYTNFEDHIIEDVYGLDNVIETTNLNYLIQYLINNENLTDPDTLREELEEFYPDNESEQNVSVLEPQNYDVYERPEFIQAIIEHYRREEAHPLSDLDIGSINEFLRDSATSIDEIIEVLEEDFRLNQVRKLRDSLEEFEPQPVSRVLDFGDEEETPSQDLLEPFERLTIEEQWDPWTYNLGLELKKLLDFLHDQEELFHENFTQEKMTLEQIEERFYNYYAYTLEPEPLSVEFMKVVETKYPKYFDSMEMIEKEELQKEFYSIFKKYFVNPYN